MNLQLPEAMRRLWGATTSQGKHRHVGLTWLIMPKTCCRHVCARSGTRLKSRLDRPALLQHTPSDLYILPQVLAKRMLLQNIIVQHKIALSTSKEHAPTECHCAA